MDVRRITAAMTSESFGTLCCAPDSPESAILPMTMMSRRGTSARSTAISLIGVATFFPAHPGALTIRLAAAGMATSKTGSAEAQVAAPDRRMLPLAVVI